MYTHTAKNRVMNKGKICKVDLPKNGICTIRLEMSDSVLSIFFQNFSCLATHIYAKGKTHALT